MIFHLLIAPSVIILVIMINNIFGLILLIAHCTIAVTNIFRVSTDGFYAVSRVNSLDYKGEGYSISSITKSSAQSPDTSSTGIAIDLGAGVADDGPIALVASPRPVIDPDHGRGRERRWPAPQSDTSS
jgi:hypothetical protein